MAVRNAPHDGAGSAICGTPVDLAVVFGAIHDVVGEMRGSLLHTPLQMQKALYRQKDIR